MRAGSTITANGTSAGAFETFNYTKADDLCMWTMSGLPATQLLAVPSVF
jgi:hypothetical protein